MPRRKPAAPTSNRKNADELYAEAERLGVDFLNADLDVAFTFVSLARHELKAGECHHFNDLMERSHRVIDTVESLMVRLPASKAGSIQKRLARLKADVRETETAASTPEPWGSPA
jgi:hypothetical protein